MWSGQPSVPQISKRKIRTGVRNKTRGYIRVIHTSLRFTSDLPETRIFLEIRTEPQKRKGRREGGVRAGSRFKVNNLPEHQFLLNFYPETQRQKGRRKSEAGGTQNGSLSRTWVSDFTTDHITVRQYSQRITGS